LSNQNILYKDISGSITITFNPIWEVQQNNINEEISSIYDNIISTKAGNIYVNNNNSWSLFYSNSTPINNLFIIDSSNGYAVCNSGILLATNLQTVNLRNLGNNNLNSIKFNNSIGFIVGDNGTIYKSNNSGSTWTLQNIPYNNKLNDVSIINSTNIIITGSGLLIKSTDGGNTWNPTFFNNSLNSIFACFFK
jgi:hypothetical protein